VISSKFLEDAAPFFMLFELSCENEKEDIITRNSLYVALCHITNHSKWKPKEDFPPTTQFETMRW